MEIVPHLRTTGGALKNWLLARAYNGLVIGALWLIGLEIIRVPWSPLWALLGAALQFLPNYGAIIALLGPEFAALLTGDGMKMIYVLILYAVIAVVDGLVLDPYLMKRTTRVPIWASILTPIVLGILWPFWGVLISAPLLAVVYAFRNRAKTTAVEKPAV